MKMIWDKIDKNPINEAFFTFLITSVNISGYFVIIIAERGIVKILLYLRQAFPRTLLTDIYIININHIIINDMVLWSVFFALMKNNNK